MVIRGGPKAVCDSPLHRSPCVVFGPSTQKDISEGIIEWSKSDLGWVGPIEDRGDIGQRRSDSKSSGIRIGSTSVVGTTDVGSINNRTNAGEGLSGKTGISADPQADSEGTSVAGAKAAGAEPEGPGPNPLGPKAPYRGQPAQKCGAWPHETPLIGQGSHRLLEIVESVERIQKHTPKTEASSVDASPASH
ncbi:hypothetical protein NDU88_003121 [Pleurodeles waltl]|uniref:Uncharacterized protein n=1 Tax=Pleurodeles waltl TaxID=8319 RepID=A0AAV7PBE6_PLEWA|nr:hypothetical protein NDU88_003121 [Pleurodeles waltl]